MGERRHLGPGNDLFHRPAGASPGANILSSMGIVMNKIQREEKPRSKILPEAVRQAPSLFTSKAEPPVRTSRVASGLKEEEEKRDKDPGTP